MDLRDVLRADYQRARDARDSYDRSRLERRAEELLREAGFTEQPDGTWS
jgi:hypothetical protein